MKTSHITVASSQGMKAGLRAYMASLAGSGLETVAARYDALTDMPSNDRFKWYCNTFTVEVNAAKGVSTKAAPRAKAQRVDVAQTGIEAEIAAAKARYDELLAASKAPAPAVERTSPTGPMCKTIERIARKTGASTELTFKLNGKTLTFAQASAYIDANIALLNAKGA